MDQYRTSGNLNQDICREIGPLFWSRGRTCFSWSAAAVMGIPALLLLSRHMYGYGVLLLLLAVPLIPTRGMRERLCHRVIHRRRYLGAIGPTESFFTEEGVFVRNQATFDQSMIRYPSISQAAETEHCFVLRLRSGWYTLVYKDSLTPEQRESFLPFLRERCPRLTVIQ